MGRMTMPPADKTAERSAVGAEMQRLVLEAITVAGGRVTPEGLVIVPERPSSWEFNERLSLVVVNPDRVDFHHLAIRDAAFRAKAMMFIHQFAGRVWRCDDRETAVLVLCPERRL